MENWLSIELMTTDIVHIHYVHSIFSLNVGLTAMRLKPDIKLVLPTTITVVATQLSEIPYGFYRGDT